MDFLDLTKTHLHPNVDKHVSEDGRLTKDGAVYQNLRGPLEREEFVEDQGGVQIKVLKSTYSVQTHLIPSNPRDGIFECRGEYFIVYDYEPLGDGRTVLILDKYAAT